MSLLLLSILHMSEFGFIAVRCGYMIISGKNVQNIAKLYGEQTKVSKTGKTAANTPVQKQDEVILSSQAQGFGPLLQKLQNMPEVRQERVAELSESIASGKYQVAAKDVAEKMLGR